jgi:hypothetical protein
MREGVVVARTWPKEKYCAFDIHLWGRFNTMDGVKKALAEAVGSPKGSVSSNGIEHLIMAVCYNVELDSNFTNLICSSNKSLENWLAPITTQLFCLLPTFLYFSVQLDNGGG